MGIGPGPTTSLLLQPLAAKTRDAEGNLSDDRLTVTTEGSLPIENGGVKTPVPIGTFVPRVPDSGEGVPVLTSADKQSLLVLGTGSPTDSNKSVNVKLLLVNNQEYNAAAFLTAANTGGNVLDQGTGIGVDNSNISVFRDGTGKVRGYKFEDITMYKDSACTGLLVSADGNTNNVLPTAFNANEEPIQFYNGSSTEVDGQTLWVWIYEFSDSCTGCKGCRVLRGSFAEPTVFDNMVELTDPTDIYSLSAYYNGDMIGGSTGYTNNTLQNGDYKVDIFLTEGTNSAKELSPTFGLGGATEDTALNVTDQSVNGSYDGTEASVSLAVTGNETGKQSNLNLVSSNPSSTVSMVSTSVIGGNSGSGSLAQLPAGTGVHMTSLEYVTIIGVGALIASFNVDTGTNCYTGGCISNTDQGVKITLP